jgi:hypothetical protein
MPLRKANSICFSPPSQGCQTGRGCSSRTHDEEQIGNGKERLAGQHQGFQLARMIRAELPGALRHGNRAAPTTARSASDSQA